MSFGGSYMMATRLLYKVVRSKHKQVTIRTRCNSLHQLTLGEVTATDPDYFAVNIYNPLSFRRLPNPPVLRMQSLALAAAPPNSRSPPSDPHLLGGASFWLGRAFALLTTGGTSSSFVHGDT